MIDNICASLNLDFFMQNSPAYRLRENSTFASDYLMGGLPSFHHSES
jgi:hypothetical protein